ncbi:hypothetical protein EYF80_004499 [Liparis tanakae]|uniref:Uncharacterized protein n=1 Tax=Liparis tanakae TaxID=230148 RepID=A0A4Z2J4L5_9TELE|nr:hypothetical protein EYF80_004499 [Liparis tanakae]
MRYECSSRCCALAHVAGQKVAGSSWGLAAPLLRGGQHAMLHLYGRSRRTVEGGSILFPVASLSSSSYTDFTTYKIPQIMKALDAERLSYAVSQVPSTRNVYGLSWLITIRPLFCSVA